MNKKLVIALLGASVSAIQLRDDDDLKLPALVDENDVAVDKVIMAQVSKVEDIAKKDDELISTMQLQLDQGLRNAQQGEMGQALAVSKLSSIKQSINTLEKNLAQEGEGVQQEMKAMLKKHNMAEVDPAKVDKIQKKADQILAQFPKVNELEKTLEIQEQDAELAQIEKKIKTTVQTTRKSITEGNREVHEKNSAIPEGARILTESQYEDQMSFVLKH